MSNQTKSLKQLQREWYAKLKKTGFEDIELKSGHLKGGAHNVSPKFVADLHSDFVESRASYYRMAAYLLNDYLFENQREKIIWAMHSEGKGQRCIIKELKRRKMSGANFEGVKKTLRKLIAEMKRRYQDGSPNQD